MNKPLHIMVDCDNVLNNLSQDWVRFLNKRHGLAVLIPAEGISHEAIYAAFSMLSREEIKFPLYNEDFAQSYTVKPGSYEALKQMVDDGHEVSIVTAHNNRTAGYKFEWITRHFPFISRDDIIITRKKQKIRGDVLIDDDPDNLRGGDFLQILFDHPNNHTWNDNGMIRVHTLAEAYAVIRSHTYPANDLH